MKIIALALNKFGGWLIWLDQQGALESFGGVFFRMGGFVYPKGYCKNCGTWLELCHNPDRPELKFCCTCNRVPSNIWLGDSRSTEGET